MRILSKTVFALAMLAPGMALAAGESTIGDRLSAMLNDMWNPLFLVVAVLSTFIGLYSMFRGLLKLAKVSDPNNTAVPNIVPALANIIVGAFLIALPDAAGMGMKSVLGAARGGSTLDSSGLDYSETGMSMSEWLTQINGGVAAVGKVENCLSSTTPAACMASNIANNVIPIAVYALFAAVFVLGLIMFGKAILDIARSSETGQSQFARGRGGMIMAAILLMNAPLAFGLLSSTLFGTDGTIGETGLTGLNSTLLTYTTGSDLEIVKRYTELIGHSFVILTFFGAWSFVRGILMIKGTLDPDNRGGGTLGMASVYIVAGVLLANAKMSTCFILNTVGGASMAAGFCV